MEKHFFLCICLAASILSVSPSFASEKGPAELILQSTIDPANPNKPKLAYFPHAKHQEKYYCSTCHHSTDKNGKKIPYDDGMEIAKCESSHNKAATYRGMPAEFSPFKNIAHKRCKGCHRKLKNEGKPAGPITCKGCHRPEVNK